MLSRGAKSSLVYPVANSLCTLAVSPQNSAAAARYDRIVPVREPQFSAAWKVSIRPALARATAVSGKRPGAERLCGVRCCTTALHHEGAPLFPSNSATGKGLVPPAGAKEAQPSSPRRRSGSRGHKARLSRVALDAGRRRHDGDRRSTRPAPHGIGISTLASGTLYPFCTAGRAAISQYQRLTLGKEAMSICCHSKRAIHGQMAMSAME